MHLTTEAIVCGVIRHGETGVVARLLTPQDGMQAGYVRGGRSRAMRPVLVAGNVVRGDYRSRTDTQLAALTVELVHSRAPLLAEPLAAAAIEWTTALAVTVLPEGQAYPHVHAALDGVLAAIESALSARGWAAALVRYEYLLLAELGFGLDLSMCVATGVREDLVWVSPKSGAAVSRAAGGAYADRLLALPAFLMDGGAADWDAIGDGLRLTGHFLRRDLLTERRAILWAARERLIVRLQRAAG